MPDIPTIVTWRDKRLEDMSREELIQALRECYIMMDDLRARHRSQTEVWRAITRVLRLG